MGNAVFDCIGYAQIVIADHNGNIWAKGTIAKANGTLYMTAGQHITVDGIIDGGFDLIMNALNGDVNINSAVGLYSPLSSTYIKANNINVLSIITQGNQYYEASGKTMLVDDHLTNGGDFQVVGLLEIFDETNVHTLGGHIYLDTATVWLMDHLSLHASSGDIHLGIVDGTFNLMLNSDGTTYLKDVHGGALALLSLITDSGGTTVIMADIFTSGMAMIFNDDVIIMGNVKLTDSNPGGAAGVFFKKSLTGQFNLTIDAGNGDVEFHAVDIRDLLIGNVNDVTFKGIANVTSFNQTDGTGTTNFGTDFNTTGLFSSGNIDVNTDFIMGIMHGDEVNLIGVSGIGGHHILAYVVANKLTVGGQNGGYMLGILTKFVNGNSVGEDTGEAAKLAFLFPNKNGNFFFNHCLINSGCPGTGGAPTVPPERVFAGDRSGGGKDGGTCSYTASSEDKNGNGHYLEHNHGMNGGLDKEKSENCPEIELDEVAEL